MSAEIVGSGDKVAAASLELTPDDYDWSKFPGEFWFSSCSEFYDEIDENESICWDWREPEALSFDDIGMKKYF